MREWMSEPCSYFGMSGFFLLLIYETLYIVKGAIYQSKALGGYGENQTRGTKFNGTVYSNKVGPSPIIITYYSYHCID